MLQIRQNGRKKCNQNYLLSLLRGAPTVFTAWWRTHGIWSPRNVHHSTLCTRRCARSKPLPLRNIADVKQYCPHPQPSIMQLPPSPPLTNSPTSSISPLLLLIFLIIPLLHLVSSSSDLLHSVCASSPSIFLWSSSVPPFRVPPFASLPSTIKLPCSESLMTNVRMESVSLVPRKSFPI